MEWSRIKSNTKRQEIYCLFIIFIFLIVGIIVEIMVQHGKTLFYIPDYGSICLTILSIQATITTLVFTVLSLMTNKMDSKYLGVSFNDFLLNLKPSIFKQKSIILTELLLIVVNAICQMAGWYNVIFTIFIISMILVTISVCEIYEAFTGTEKIEEEIEAYVKYINNVNEKDIKLSIAKLFNLTYQWREIVTTQSDSEYQNYLDNFNCLFPFAFSDDVNRNKLLTYCAALSKSLFDSKTDENSLRGFNFVQNCYDQVWQYIKKNEAEIAKSNFSFSLFSEVYPYFISAFSEVDIRKIEKDFSCFHFIDTLIQNTLYLEEKTIKDSKENDKNNLFTIDDIAVAISFSYFLGDLISNVIVSDASIKINEKFWERPLECFISLFTYPEDLKEAAEQITAECRFNYMLAQVKHGNYKLISNSWYREISTLSNLEDCKYYAYMAIKLHCYIYYLAFYETAADTNIIDSAKKFINDDNVITEFYQFITGIAERDENIFNIPGIRWKGINIFNDQLEQNLEEDLRWQEFIPDGALKTLVLPDAVKDFTTFLACFISNKFQNNRVLMSVIPENEVPSYYARYISTDRKDKLKQFFKIMGVKDGYTELIKGGKVNNLDIRTETSYAELTKVIKDKYKAYTLNEAENSKKFTANDYQQQTKSAQNELIEFLKQHFSGLISNDIEEDTNGELFKRNGYEHLNIFTFRVFSDTNIEDLMKDYYDQMFVIICETLFQRLMNGNYVNRFNKETLTDKDLLQYTEKNNKVIIGSQYALYPEDYHDYEKIDDWLSENESYITNYKGSVLILDKGKLKLNFRNAQIRIRKETINDLIERKSAHLNEKTGYYNYSPVRDRPIDFTKEEFSHYLTNKRRIVYVSLEMGVEVVTNKDRKIGDVIKMQ